MTYAELAARLAALMVTDATLDADFATMLPTIIETGELRCYRELVPLALLRTQTLSVAPGTRQVSMPADFIAARSVALYTATAKTYLRKRDDRFLAAYWPDSAVTGTPKYWGEVSYGVMQFVPPPAVTTTIEMEYVQRPATLSASNPTTWLSVFAPDLLIAACMIFAAGYQKNFGMGDDPRTPSYWQGEYAAALAGLAREEAQRRNTVDTPPA